MKLRYLLLLLFVLAGILVVFQRVQAMDSEHYRLDWFTPLTGSGGRASSSTNYAAELTIGQTANRGSESASFTGRMGFWSYRSRQYRLHLPVMVREGP